MATTAIRTKRSCLFESLNNHITNNNIPSAISLLPLLSRHGFRPSLSTFSLLLSLSPSLLLSRQLLLYLRVFNLDPLPSLPLSNQILSLRFLLHQPQLARNLFDQMPQRNLLSYNTMLAGYSRLRMLPAASRIFTSMPIRDAASFNILISALARAGKTTSALRLYKKLRSLPIPPNHHTFSSLVSACSTAMVMRQAHGQVLVFGLLMNLVVATGIVDGYARCGCLEEARSVFDEMEVRDVQCWTVLVNAYAKSGDLEDGRSVFDKMPVKNSVSWTAMIGGYVRVGLHFEALDLFKRMVEGELCPDQFTFSSILCTCATLGSVKYGKQIHARFFRSGFSPNLMVISTLIDMYSKCGNLEGGRHVFDRMDASVRDVVMWNTMMSSSVQHGDGREAIRLFEEMVGEGIKPDANTFVVLLTACGRLGLVVEGMQYIDSMRRKHGIVPEEDHYVCLVDLLGRGGQFGEALVWLSKMSCHSSSGACVGLLKACRNHKYLHLRKHVAERLIELDPQCSEAYLLLSDLHAQANKCESEEKNKRLKEEKRVTRAHATSWIEVDNIVHLFWSVDHLHPAKEDIYNVLEFLASHQEENSFTG